MSRVVNEGAGWSATCADCDWVNWKPARVATEAAIEAHQARCKGKPERVDTPVRTQTRDWNKREGATWLER